MQTEKSSGNIFEDLGFEEAENLRIRADLMLDARRYIEEQDLTQRAAATRLGVSQPRISDLMRGHIEKFTIDTLVNMLSAAGLRVRIAVEDEGRREAA